MTKAPVTAGEMVLGGHSSGTYQFSDGSKLAMKTTWRQSERMKPDGSMVSSPPSITPITQVYTHIKISAEPADLWVRQILSQTTAFTQKYIGACALLLRRVGH